MNIKNTIVILGASSNPLRTSYMAAKLLLKRGCNLLAIANQKGFIGNLPIHEEEQFIKNTETIILFLNPKQQKKYYNYILELKPKCILFNPGTENMELANMAISKKIKVIETCSIEYIMSSFAM